MIVANEQNLIPFSERSKSEAIENGRKGGKASGKSRRRRKAMREYAQLLLSLPVSDKQSKEELSRLGIGSDDIDNQMLVIVGLWQRACAGDVQAVKELRNIIGEDNQTGNDTDKESNLLQMLQKGLECEDDDVQ